MTAKKSEPKPSPGVELEPDAWERFERFIKEVAKKPPQHRPAKKPDSKKG
jgi:hypothetical protein